MSSSNHVVIQSARDLHCGEHISWPTQALSGITRHHAIVLAWKGQNIVRVIHVTSKEDEPEQYGVCEELVDVEVHIRQGTLYRYEYDPDACYEPFDVVRRAASKIGQFEYSLWGNNCEHFVRWCITDKSKSSQAQLAIGIGSTAAGAVVVGAAGTLVGLFHCR